MCFGFHSVLTGPCNMHSCLAQTRSPTQSRRSLVALRAHSSLLTIDHCRLLVEAQHVHTHADALVAEQGIFLPSPGLWAALLPRRLPVATTPTASPDSTVLHLLSPVRRSVVYTRVDHAPPIAFIPYVPLSSSLRPGTSRPTTTTCPRSRMRAY